jgi:hypothetical protein
MLVSRKIGAKAVAAIAAFAMMAMIWLPFGLAGAPNDSTDMGFWSMLHGKVSIEGGSNNYIAFPDDGENDPDPPPPPPPGH